MSPQERTAGTVARSRLILATAWGFVGIGTILPQILARELFGVDPSWLPPLQIAAIVLLLSVSTVDRRFRSLQVFAGVLLVVQIQFLVDWTTIEGVLGLSVPPGLWTWAADRTLSFGFAAVLLAVLFLRGDDRERLFLVRGDLSARVEPVPIPGLRGGRSWRWVAPRWGGGILLVTAVVLAFQGGSFWMVGHDRLTIAVIVVVILSMAALNAFNEEFLFRAAPLAALTEGVGKRQALLLLAVVFGISHFYGTPAGVPAVLMGIFLGWFLGKSMLETRGIGFAFGLHFLLDVLVFSFA